MNNKKRQSANKKNSLEPEWPWQAASNTKTRCGAPKGTKPRKPPCDYADGVDVDDDDDNDGDAYDDTDA